MFNVQALVRQKTLLNGDDGDGRVHVFRVSNVNGLFLRPSLRGDDEQCKNGKPKRFFHESSRPVQGKFFVCQRLAVVGLVDLSALSAKLLSTCCLRSGSFFSLFCSNCTLALSIVSS